MTVAYCVMSHTRPEQVLRLVRTLRTGSPNAPILVHHDPSGPPLLRADLDRVGGVRLVAPVGPVQWGRGSQLDMLLRCVDVALARTAFDWLVLLSGQDYPARPLAAIEADLAVSELDGHVDGHVVAPPRLDRREVDEFARRYFYAWRAVGEPGRLGRRALRAARPLLAVRDVPSGVLVGRRCRTPFGPALPCRRGQDWLTLSRRAAAVLHHAATERPDLVAHYRHTVLPTESFPHTVLHADGGLRLSGDSRRFVRFAPDGPHPEILTLANLDAVLASGTDFARKFDVRVDARVLDALDAALSAD